MSADMAEMIDQTGLPPSTASENQDPFAPVCLCRSWIFNQPFVQPAHRLRSSQIDQQAAENGKHA